MLPRFQSKPAKPRPARSWPPAPGREPSHAAIFLAALESVAGGKVVDLRGWKQFDDYENKEALEPRLAGVAEAARGREHLTADGSLLRGQWPEVNHV